MSSSVSYLSIVIVCTLLAVTRSQKSDPGPQGSEASKTDICNKLCFQLNICPTDCLDIYKTKDKRFRGIEGLTFNDYIFMHLLGRDTARGRKLY